MSQSILIAAFLTVSLGLSHSVAAQHDCDSRALNDAKATFQRLADKRGKDRLAVSPEQLRGASNAFIAEAEKCYADLYGDSSPYSAIVDYGGLPPVHQTFQSDAKASLRQGSREPDHHVLYGTKWGAGSPFLPIGENVDANGPQLPGGTVTYSFMSSGVNLATEVSWGNSASSSATALWDLTEYQTCFIPEIEAAFAAWGAAANIQFMPVADNGAAFNVLGASGHIRVGAHDFDGAWGVVAHAYYPPYSGSESSSSASGDLHFDTAELWACDSSTGIDIGLIAVHEIGHALGLRHETTDPSVMSTPHDPATELTGLLADDLLGITEIYGQNPNKRSFFSDLGIGTESPAASVHVRRYDGTAQLLVEETSESTANRTMFRLTNNGAPWFKLLNSDTGQEWTFAMDQFDNFIFSRIGTGGSEFKIYQNGQVVMGPGGASAFDLQPNGDLSIAGDLTANGYFYVSDSNRKENFSPVDHQDILERLASLEISFWNFRDDPSKTLHLGPTAQEFHAAFDFRGDERHISASDISGVALAAIQGLYSRTLRELARRDARLAAQQAELDKLKARLARLEAQVGAEGSR